jgi:hypothetical protein
MLLASLLLIVLGARCSGDRPLRPLSAERPEYAGPSLVLEVGGDVLRITDPEGVNALLETLPAADRAVLFAAGCCTTRDPAFRAALSELCPRLRDARGGFAGHIRNQTWGEIKIRFLT